jgi:hypothetical protein
MAPSERAMDASPGLVRCHICKRHRRRHTSNFQFMGLSSSFPSQPSKMRFTAALQSFSCKKTAVESLEILNDISSRVFLLYVLMMFVSLFLSFKDETTTLQNSDMCVYIE